VTVAAVVSTVKVSALAFSVAAVEEVVLGSTGAASVVNLV
jgi:hypothetical protein